MSRALRRPRRIAGTVAAPVTVTMVVGDPAALTTGDTVLRDRMVARGWTVTLVDDDSAADTTARSLTVISESCSSASVGSKYSTLAQPAVLMESFVADSWNLATADPGSFINPPSARVHSTHPAAGGIAVGTYSLATSGDLAQFPNANVPASANKFLTDNTTPTNIVGFAIESGAAILNSATAAARRVFLGYQGTMLAGTPTANAMTIFDACCDWAKGASSPPPPSTSLTALLVCGTLPRATADTAVYNRLVSLGYTVTSKAVADAEDTGTYSVVVISPTCFNILGKYSTSLNPVLNLHAYSWGWWYLIRGDSTIDEVADGNGYVHSGHALAGSHSTGWYALSTTPATANQQWRVQNSAGGFLPSGAIIYLTHSTDVDDWPIGFGFSEGQSIFSGNVTPNRRVCLGWTSLFFEIGVSSQGWILFDAAMNWLAASESSTPTEPGMPGTATGNSGDGYVALSSTAAASNGSAITKYIWEAYTSAGTVPHTIKESTGPNINFDGLVNGTGVRFRHKAVNAVGEGPLSAYTSVFTPAAGVVASTFYPTIIPIWQGELINSYRGQNQWINEGDSLKPSWWPWMDSYDRLGWWQLETSEGVYDFQDIERRLALAAARTPKGRHSLGIMSALSYNYGSSVWHHGSYVPSYNGGLQVPQYIRNSCPGWQRGGSWFPDWNHERYLSRWEALMMALGNAYRDDPRFGYMDIRGYGDFGEWHIYGLTDSVGSLDEANGPRLVDATVDAFRGPDGKLKKYCVMLGPVDSALRYAVGLDPKVGIRGDCLGGTLPGPFAGYMEPASHPARQKWTTAPVVAEWCGIDDYNRQYQRAYEDVEPYHLTTFSGGNIEAENWHPNYWMYEEAIKRNGYRFELREVQVGTLTAGGTFAVTSKWANVNVNPAYDPWVARFELRQSGTVRASWDSTLNFMTFLPGEKTHFDNFAVPAGLPSGTHELSVKVIDSGNYLDPMNLAITGRQADGRHILGNVVRA